MSDEWGVGNKTKEKAFDTAQVGKQAVDLIFGEHPHSRRDNTTYARFPSGDIEGFDGHRICTKIEIEESNYLKTSGLSGNQVRKTCTVKVFFNGEQVFEDWHRTYDRAYELAKKYIEWSTDLLGSGCPIRTWKKKRMG